MQEVCAQVRLTSGTDRFLYLVSVGFLLEASFRECLGAIAVELILHIVMWRFTLHAATISDCIYSPSRYPFLLPNLAGSIGAAILLPLVILYIPETKEFPSKAAAGELSR